MPEKKTLETRKIDELRNHPLNLKVFGELANSGPDAELVESVKVNGILQPILVTATNVVLSGHRRKLAAVRAGLKEVPVIVRHDITGGLEGDRAWFEANRNREMTVEQRALWYEQRAEIEAMAAKEREKSGKKVDPEPKGQNVPRVGKAKDLAAREAGIDKRTADKAVEVVHKIKEAEAAGDVETAADLRETLNTKSVAAAHRKATAKPPVESPASLVDAIGCEVPKQLNAAASTAAALETLARKLDPIRREAERIGQVEGGEFVEMATVNRLIRELKTAIGHAAYWTACPRCDGKKCDRCKHGWIPRCKSGQLSAEDKLALGIE